jgi:hypothetical protein
VLPASVQVGERRCCRAWEQNTQAAERRSTGNRAWRAWRGGRSYLRASISWEGDTGKQQGVHEAMPAFKATGLRGGKLACVLQWQC